MCSCHTDHDLFDARVQRTCVSIDLAQKINRLLGADEMRREMGGNARSFVLEELDPELHYRRLLSIYERHINN